VPLRSVVFSHDGAWLATGSVDGTVTVWDAATRAVARQVTGSRAAVNAVAFDASDDNVLFFDDTDPEGGAVSLRAAR
jgi:WD40 repeat protein